MKAKDKLIELIRDEEDFTSIKVYTDKELFEYLTEASQDILKEFVSDTRYLNNFDRIVKIKNTLFLFEESESKNDNYSVEDSGYSFDWDSLKIVEAYEEVITVTKYREVS